MLIPRNSKWLLRVVMKEVRDNSQGNDGAELQGKGDNGEGWRSIPGEQAASAKAWPPPRGPRMPLQSSRQTRDRIWFVFLKDL